MKPFSFNFQIIRHFCSCFFIKCQSYTNACFKSAYVLQPGLKNSGTLELNLSCGEIFFSTQVRSSENEQLTFELSLTDAAEDNNIVLIVTLFILSCLAHFVTHDVTSGSKDLSRFIRTFYCSSKNYLYLFALNTRVFVFYLRTWEEAVYLLTGNLCFFKLKSNVPNKK